MMSGTITHQIHRRQFKQWFLTPFSSCFQLSAHVSDPSSSQRNLTILLVVNDDWARINPAAIDGVAKLSH
jgi:hypothetical protein